MFLSLSSFSFSIFKLFFLLFCFRQLFSKFAFSTCSSGFIFWKLIRYVNFGVPPVSAGWSPEICGTYLFICGFDFVPMRGLSLVAVSGGYSLVAARELLSVVTSLVEHGCGMQGLQ